MAMAFGIFGKRRRDGEPPGSDEELAVAAACGCWPRRCCHSARVRHRSCRGHDAALATALTHAGPQGRSRSATPPRPRASPSTRACSVRSMGTSDESSATAWSGCSTRPTSCGAREIGYLDRGDEVQLLEKYGAYWMVLCPDGRQGWVHNMTLGDVVSTRTSRRTDPSRRCPLAAETWTMGESDDDTRRPRGLPRVAPPRQLTRGRSPCAAPGRAGGRCSARTTADNRRAGAAMPAWYQIRSPLGTNPTSAARAARSDPVNRYRPAW